MLNIPHSWHSINRGRSFITANLPGVMVCVVIALAATFLSEHYGGPQLLYALLIGMSLHFLSTNANVNSGINFCSKSILRVGVALLGARITVGQVADLGWTAGAVVVAAVALTIGAGLLLARWLKRPTQEGLLSGAAVGICGASAALAVSSVLPQTKENERFTLLAVVGVTVLSTVAMILYPFTLKILGFTFLQSGIVLGGTIHDVGQVVAAGMMLDQKAADAATVVKLFRVMLLMPVVLVISFIYRKHTYECRDEHTTILASNNSGTGKTKPATKPQLVPNFLMCFIALVVLSSLGTFPPAAVQWAGDLSRGCLVIAIAAAGVKTSFEDLSSLGWTPTLMLVAETLFIALFVVAGVLLLGLGLPR